MGSAYGDNKAKDTDFRRKWDREEYAERARKREERERFEAMNADRKKRGLAPLKDKNEPEQEKTLLTHRESKISFDHKVGKVEIVKDAGEKRNQPGFYCELCDSVFKDSKGYLDHVNSRKHQSKLGVAMKVERSTADQVKDRLAELKRKKMEGPDEKKEYDLNSRIEELKQQEQDEKAQRKERKRQKKQEKEKESTADLPATEDADDMAKMMGFSGFGSTKS
ncbi:hypothetical protein DM01DRAFT_1380010 [Hesseltinella vesiculosa]|uniref:C2H2-type domain-containing protein n=1 Tax=Hesseltinella vesiculosa TaxID=101127 RepID=A0A1X2GVX5_9FUNG|nr:hypothetical protein DM01DRAFT_1380010 [Hesseltinella vesiculosa]